MTTIDQNDHRLSSRDPRKVARLIAEDEAKHREKLALSEKARARYEDFKKRRTYWETACRELDDILLAWTEEPALLHMLISKRESYDLVRVLPAEFDQRIEQLRSGKVEPLWWTQFHEDVNNRKEWRRKNDPEYDKKMAEKERRALEKEWEKDRLERQAQLEAEAAEKALELRLFDDILGGAA